MSARRRPARSFVLLREVEVDSPVHRLWAGTKLLAAVAVSLTISLVPQWPVIGVLAVLLVGAAALARVPLRAVPRPPGWFWALFAAGGALTLISGGRPEVAVGAGHLGLGGIDVYLQFTAVSVVLLGAGALIGWTTSLGDIGPAVGRLLRPLAVLRVPVDEWATTIALCIRGLPLLVGEIRVLLAARRLRPPKPRKDRLTAAFDEAADLLVATLAVTLRRAGEMGEAITARGGTGTITASDRRPEWRDATAIGVVAAVCVAAGSLLP